MSIKDGGRNRQKGGFGQDGFGFRDDLRRYEHFYNNTRPHQALAYKTPAEFLASPAPAPTTTEKENLSRTS